jgi:SAM-dependent methyltransferase
MKMKSEKKATNPFRYSLPTRLRERIVFKWLQRKRGQKILDLGCGTGYFASKLAAEGPFVVGMDLDISSVKFAKKNGMGHFVVGSAERLPFKDNTFDALLSTEVLEHLPVEDQALREVTRVGSDGAQFVLTVPSLDGILSKSPYRRLGHNEEGTEYHYRDGYRMLDIKNMLQVCGIQVVKARYSTGLFAEVIIESIKLIYLKFNPSFTSQADLTKSESSLLFSLNKYIVFPLVFGISLIEEMLLGKGIKGHNIALKGAIAKK